MSTPVIVVAALFVKPGQEQAFQRFEREALSILREHGGRLEHAIRPVPLPGTRLCEVHVLAFPSQGAFDAYRGDPRLAALAALRAAVVEETLLWSGPDAGPEYPG